MQLRRERSLFRRCSRIRLTCQFLHRCLLVPFPNPYTLNAPRTKTRTFAPVAVSSCGRNRGQKSMKGMPPLEPDLVSHHYIKLHWQSCSLASFPGCHIDQEACCFKVYTLLPVSWPVARLITPAPSSPPHQPASRGTDCTCSWWPVFCSVRHLLPHNPADVTMMFCSSFCSFYFGLSVSCWTTIKLAAEPNKMLSHFCSSLLTPVKSFRNLN